MQNNCWWNVLGRFKKVSGGIVMTGIFEWQTGTPVEYGSYLVLHLDAYNRRVIHHDVWFDDRKCWQSQWHNIVAWCKFGDIHIMEEGGEK